MTVNVGDYLELTRTDTPSGIVTMVDTSGTGSQNVLLEDSTTHVTTWYNLDFYQITNQISNPVETDYPFGTVVYPVTDDPSVPPQFVRSALGWVNFNDGSLSTWRAVRTLISNGGRVVKP